jgi:hypothetical protein
VRQVFVGFAVFLVISGAAVQSQSPRDGDKRTLPNFDIRESGLGIAPGGGQQQAQMLVERRRANLASYVTSSEQMRLGTRIVPSQYGLPKLYVREVRPLAAPSGLKPLETAKRFLETEPEVFAMTRGEIDRLRLLVDDTSGNAKFLAFNQTVNGIDVFNGHIKFTLNRLGEIIQVATGDVIPGLDIPTVPRLTADQAVRAAFAAVGNRQSAAPARVPQANGKIAFANPNGNGFSPITSELTIFPMNAASARLAYRIFLEVDQRSWYEMLIDAESGELLFRHNLYVFAAQANVWTESPVKGTRTLVTFPATSTASPAGWLPATGTVTTGNNVDAYLDANGNDAPDGTSDLNMKEGRAYSPTQVFDFQFGDGTVQLDPRSYQPAGVTNLFYFVNAAHDYYYGLGFNEAAGNFQTNNFDRGGSGNDAIVAEAQFGLFPNNAAFSVTPEGTAPRLRMGIFSRGTSSGNDDLDSSYDGPIVFHEYMHGVSSRLVGARTSTSCLRNIQSSALGEGWSDYFSSSFFNSSVQGAYIGQDATRGVRRYNYEGYPLTFEDIGNGTHGYEAHDDGEIWAGTLWDLRKSLGAAVTDRLVMDGLKSTPCNPSMTDARDAILSADQAANGGANRKTIWTVFARHGMGYSAVGVDGTLLTGTRYDAAYDLPPDLQGNRSPAITSNPLLLRTGLGDAYNYQIAASNPEGGTLTYALTSGPGNMAVNANGSVTWIPGFLSTRVKITVTDGKGGKVVHGYALPVVTALGDGKPLTLAGSAGATGFATINVPARTPVLQVKMRGGSGDADLFVKDPSGAYSMSAQEGTTETISFANPAPGVWQVEVDAFTDYAGVALTASMAPPTVFNPNSPLTNLSGDFTSETFYRITVPPGAMTLSVTTGGGTGDVDILLRKDYPAVCQPFLEVLADCVADKSSMTDGNSEFISVSSPGAGDWYLDVVGYSQYSGVRLDIVVTVPPLTLTTPGAATTLTSGASPSVAAGYAVATVESGTAPYGIAVFSLSQNGSVVSETGVPASPTVQNARIFIDYRTGVAAGNGTIDVLTGVAIANRNTSPASLTLTLRNRAGHTIATGHGVLPAGGHRAKFVHQLQDVAPDFNIPANFSTAVQYGSLDISSSLPVSVLGLRLTTNQRGETLLTSTAVTDVARPAGISPVYFPQLVDGAGYTTSLVLTNTSGAAQNGTISVLDGNGQPLSVRPVGGAVGTSFTYSISPAGTFVFQTDGTSSPSRVGWVTVTPASGSTSPSGAGVVSYSPAGILVTETGVPSVAPTTRARMYVDKSTGHDTGIAIANPGSAPLRVTVQAFQTNGATVGNGVTTLNVPANGHTAAFAGQMITGLPDGFTGIADLTSSTPFVPLTLRSLTNSRGDFLLTTFPAPDVTQAAPSPLVFPQIADGGGYSTQLIFISGTGTASVSVKFIGDDGTPLTVGSNP